MQFSMHCEGLVLRNTLHNENHQFQKQTVKYDLGGQLNTFIGLLNNGAKFSGQTKLGSQQGIIDELGLLVAKAKNLILPALLSVNSERKAGCFGAAFQGNMAKGQEYSGKRNGVLLQQRAIVSILFL
jgi:hypothetical protein